MKQKINELICKIFDHKWIIRTDDSKDICARCGKEIKINNENKKI